jgi:hypothetical protein
MRDNEKDLLLTDTAVLGLPESHNVPEWFTMLPPPAAESPEARMYLHLYASRLAFPREPAAAQSRLTIEAYLDGYSPNVQEIIDNFEFRNHIPRLSKADALGTLIEKFLEPIDHNSTNPNR